MRHKNGHDDPLIVPLSYRIDHKGRTAREMKRRLIMEMLLAAALMLLLLCACGQKAAPPTWQEQYDLGVRYLSEGNYEEAVIAFTAAIEINPQNVEPYLSLADIYVTMEDFDHAQILLGRAYDFVFKKNDIDKITAFITQYPELCITSQMLNASDFIINGKDIGQCTLEEFMEIYPSVPNDYSAPLREKTMDEKLGVAYTPALKTSDGTTSGAIWAWAQTVDSKVELAVFAESASFLGADHTAKFDLRSIQLGDDQETVVAKMGLSELGQKMLQKDVGSITFTLLETGEWYIYFPDQGKVTDKSSGYMIYDAQHGGSILLQFYSGLLDFVQYDAI